MPTVQTNDIQTYYERRGGGPPVVFVHGAHVDHSIWAPQFEALATDYTVVAYDVRGHGRTGASDVAHYSIELFVDDLHALLTALDIDRPVLCGFSMGGAIAQAYATTYPGTLSGLVLSDTFTPGDWRLPERLHWLMLRTTIPLARFGGFERIERAMVRVMERVRGESVSHGYETIEAIRAEPPPIATEEFEKVTRALLRFPESSLDLSTVTAPALVMWGQHEPSWMKRQAAEMAAALPDVRLVEIPEAGHAGTLSHPEVVTEALRRFLERTAEGSVGSPGTEADDPTNSV